MQNQSFAANNDITAPSGCEAFDLISTAAFSVTYYDFKDAVPAGDAAPAVPFGASSFLFTVYAPRGYGFKPTQKVAKITGATAAVLCCPRRIT